MIERIPSLLVVVAVVLLLGYFLLAKGGDTTSADARRIVQEGGRLLDVRTPEEFAAGHLPGAVNIPVQELEQRLGELSPKDRPVVLYCRSGRRSGTAKGLLERSGFAAVHDLGAMSRW